jgi:hypothetical protein
MKGGGVEEIIWSAAPVSGRCTVFAGAGPDTDVAVYKMGR